MNERIEKKKRNVFITLYIISVLVIIGLLSGHVIRPGLMPPVLIILALATYSIHQAYCKYITVKEESKN